MISVNKYINNFFDSYNDRITPEYQNYIKYNNSRIYKPDRLEILKIQKVNIHDKKFIDPIYDFKFDKVNKIKNLDATQFNQNIKLNKVNNNNFDKISLEEKPFIQHEDILLNQNEKIDKTLKKLDKEIKHTPEKKEFNIFKGITGKDIMHSNMLKDNGIADKYAQNVIGIDNDLSLEASLGKFMIDYNNKIIEKDLKKSIDISDITQIDSKDILTKLPIQKELLLRTIPLKKPSIKIRPIEIKPVITNEIKEEFKIDQIKKKSKTFLKSLSIETIDPLNQGKEKYVESVVKEIEDKNLKEEETTTYKGLTPKQKTNINLIIANDKHGNTQITSNELKIIDKIYPNKFNDKSTLSDIRKIITIKKYIKPKNLA